MTSSNGNIFRVTGPLCGEFTGDRKMMSFWRNFHHWLHRKLSKWQLSVQSVIKISSKWHHFRFSEWLPGTDPFYWHGFILIPPWISNYIHNIKCPFPNFTGHMITYPCWDQSWFLSVKGARGQHASFLTSGYTFFPWGIRYSISFSRCSVLDRFEKIIDSSFTCDMEYLNLNCFMHIELRNH